MYEWIVQAYQYYYELKSDQNGIEIQSGGEFEPGPGALKSDQNGIEIHYSFTSFSVVHIVKIRPKWDWNYKGKGRVGDNWGLKSDQNGIEMIGTLFIMLGYSYLLKSDQNGIEIHELYNEFEAVEG